MKLYFQDGCQYLDLCGVPSPSKEMLELAQYTQLLCMYKGKGELSDRVRLSKKDPYWSFVYFPQFLHH